MATPTVLHRMAAGWRELGRTGRVAFVGIAFSALIAVAVGVAIPRILENHLLEEREATLGAVVADLEGAAILSGPAPDLAALQEFVDLRVLGGDTVRVKVWAPDGEIVWSDEPRLIGQRFDVRGQNARAFAGEVTSHLSSLQRPEHAFDRHFGRLLEFYVPVRMGDEIPYVFEVYQRADPLTTTIGRTRRTVWLSISLGLGTMGMFMVGAAAAVVASADRRRRQAEHLLARHATIREEERARLATAMHDDMGQPLYRLLYGLESLDVDYGDEAARDELTRLRAIVREIDDTVRGELRRLQQPPLADRSLPEALIDLAGSEGDHSPTVEIDIRTTDRTSPRAEEVLYRAVREAVTNARRHAGAASIRLSVDRVGDRLTAVIADDGHGTTGEPGLGSAVVAAMLTVVEGGIDTHAERGVGTTVTI